jgi:hypothetical protein
MPPGAGADAKASKRRPAADWLGLAAGGLEAEFTLLIDERPARPEQVFGDPRGFLDLPLMHRTGRSFHLPTAAAIYFDTGVIELATPVMELERGCFARLARSLDESLALVRAGLDRWQRRTGHRARLQGFSAHYNVSPLTRPPAAAAAIRARDVERFERLAWLLAHILPAPVMLLATNRSSTGVGIRPRAPRFEVTADFSPDPRRIAATGAVAAGIIAAVTIAAVTNWPDATIDRIRGLGIPVIEGFAPMPHTSRAGWLARVDCFPDNPFACDPDAAIWPTDRGRLSLRAIARRVWDVFAASIALVADRPSFALAAAIIAGTSTSWLDQADRPAAYDDVAGDRAWGARALARFGRSRYERIVRHAVARVPLRLDDGVWMPYAVHGWSRIALRRQDGARRIMSLDALLPYLERWAS